MKNSIISLFLILSVSLIANELEWVDEQINAIKPARSGLSKSQINAVRDPFVFLKKEKKATTGKRTIATKTASNKSSVVSSKNTISKKAVSLTLDAIINKSALINGKWYGLNSKVGKYTLSSVDRTSVILSYKTKELLLSTRSKNNKLKFKNN